MKEHESPVVKLDSKVRSRDIGWDYTTEDMSMLISGLSAINTKGGAYLGIGSFHNLDIALDREVDAIVLMDIDGKVATLNKKVLDLIDQTSDFEDALPRMRGFIKKTDYMGTKFFEEYISTGTYLRNRTLLSWAKTPEHFFRIKELIQEGKVAVVLADITKPKTLAVVGDFFSSLGTFLQFANITNVENPGHCVPDEKEMKALKRIPIALVEAGGIDKTLVISSLSAARDIPKDFNITVLKSSVDPVPDTGSIFTFRFNYLVRNLEDFRIRGPFIPEI